MQLLSIIRLSFSVCLTSFSMIISSSLQFAASAIISLFLMAEKYSIVLIYICTDSFYVESKKKKRYKWIFFTKQKQTHRLWERIYGYQRKVWGRNRLGAWTWQACMPMFKTDNQQGEKEMATLSIILAWEISWTEEPGKSQTQLRD